MTNIAVADKTIVVTDSDGTYTVDTDKIEWIDTDTSDTTMSYDGELYIKSDENDDTMYFNVWDA